MELESVNRTAGRWPSVGKRRAPQRTQEMAKPLSMRRNFLWAFAGQIIFSLSGWGMLICIAKLGNPQMVGQYALGVALTQPVFMLMGLNLRTVLVTDVKREYSLGHFAALRLLCVAVSLAVVALLAPAFGGGRETAWVVFLTGFAVAFDTVSDLAYAIFTRWERLDRQAISLAVRGLLSLVFLAIGVKLTGSVVYGIAGSALASILITTLYDIPSCLSLLHLPEPGRDTHATAQSAAGRAQKADWKQILPDYDWPVLARLLRYALPLGLILFLLSLNTHVPRYCIEHLLGERALGIFAAMALIVNAGRTAVLSLSYATAKRLAESYERGDHRVFLRVLSKMVAISLMVGLPPILFATVFGKQFLTLMYRPEYASHTDIFVLVLASGAVGYLAVCLGCAMTAAKINGVQLAWQAGATLIVGVFCLLLVPQYGLRGAAYATLLSVTAQVLSGALLLARTLRADARRRQTTDMTHPTTS